MKKFLYTVFGLVFVALAAALVGPSFINWNDYKADGVAILKSLTGRDVMIDGDIQIAILPAPALIAKDIRVGNIEGAAAPEMVRIKSLEVRLALEPLIRGEIQVETIRLVEPVIEIETFADGHNNLDFSPVKDISPQENKPEQLPLPPSEDIRSAAPADKNAPPSAAPVPASESDPAQKSTDNSLGLDLRLDNFVIVDGTVIYRNGKDGSVERLDSLNAKVAAQSLTGPLESSGSLVVRGISFNYDASVGEFASERAIPFSLKLADSSSGSDVMVVGTILSLIEKFKIKGALKGKGDNLAQLLSAVGKGGTLPGYLFQPFSFEGPLEATPEGLDIKKLSVRLGDTAINSVLSIKLGKTIDADLKVEIKQANLNKLLAMAPKKFKAKPVASSPKNGGNSNISVSQGVAPGESPKATSKSGFSIPTGINASLSVSAQSLIYMDGIIREAQANAELANGEITISRLSAKLPGGGETALFGFITAAQGKPRFEGDVEANINDLRKLLAWAKVDNINVPYDRLRRLSFSGKVVVTPELAQIGDVNIQFDSSKLTGGITVALRARPSFGANLTLDRINVDAYLPTNVETVQKETVKKQGEAAPLVDGGGQKSPPPKKTKAVDPLVVLNGLKSFDANIKAHIKTLVYKGNAIKDAFLDATLFNGALDLRRASVNKLAGASATISGKISKIGLLPEMKDINIQVNVPDVSRLARLVGSKLPLDAKKLGAVTLTGAINGSALNPAINVGLKAAGGVFTVNGAISFLPLIGGFKGAVTAKHANLSRLLSALGVDYKPQGKLGGLDIATNIKADTKTVSLEGIKGHVGPITVAGNANVRIDGPLPKITADLQTGRINIDQFMPAKRRAALSLPGGNATKTKALPASWPAPMITAPVAPLLQAIKAVVGGKWSNDPIDLSALHGFNVDLKLKSSAISHEKYILENVDLVATLNKGVLQSNKISGVLFGGSLNANTTVYAMQTPTIKTSMTLINLNVGKALQAISGKAKATGAMDLRLNLTTTGRNVANMVSTLTGDGSVAMRNVEIDKKTAGDSLGMILGLNKFGGGGGLNAGVTSSFIIQKGVVRSQDIKLVSSIGEGDATANVDLPKWEMNVVGNVRLSQNTLTTLVAKQAKMTTVLPFKINGDIDSPSIILDTSKMPGGALALPGKLTNKLQKKINKLEKKLEKKGLGGFLNKIAPGLLGVKPHAQPQAQPSQVAPSEPPPLTTQTQQPTEPQKPEDAIKGFLKGLMR